MLGGGAAAAPAPVADLMRDQALPGKRASAGTSVHTRARSGGAGEALVIHLGQRSPANKPILGLRGDHSTN